MNILVFTHLMGGHHLEYIHHIYEAAGTDYGNKYTFLLPQSFLEKRDKFDWVPLSNVDFDFFEDRLFEEDPSTVSEMLLNSYRLCRFLGKYSKHNNINLIYSNHMIVFVPFAPFFIRGTKIVGIIYRIYLHELNELSWKQKTLDRTKYLIMSLFRVYKKVLILNDQYSANRLNSLFHTHKFSFLPDPYLPLSSNEIVDIREKYNIDKSKALFVHFGAMSSNKGTLEVLESIRYLSQEEKNRFAFVLAGRIADDIRNEFYSQYNLLKDNVQMVVVDEYCSYNYFASLCVSCDAILTPYRRTSQSSGLIGYASQFKKPVIAPSKGLLGKLVSDYKLGILVDDCSPQKLIEAYNLIANGRFETPSNDYCEIHSIEAFKIKILNYIKE